MPLRLILLVSLAIAARAQPSTNFSIPVAYFLGQGRTDARPEAVEIGANGDIWVAGVAHGNGFPTVEAFDPDYDPGLCYSVVGAEACPDLFLARLSAEGDGLRFSTYLGGPRREVFGGLAIGADGAVYLTGTTESPDFAFDRSLGETGQGERKPFLVKLDADGELLFGARLPGDIFPQALAVDDRGAAYVGGSVFRYPRGNLRDGAFLVVAPHGDTVERFVLLGGRGDDAITDLEVDAAGQVYAVGSTDSLDFPTTTNPTGREPSTDWDSFLAVWGTEGDQVIWSARLGGSSDELYPRLGLGADGRAWITGVTSSADLPLENPLAAGSPTGDFAFWLAAVDPAQNRLALSTYFGEVVWSGLPRIAIDGGGFAYVSGRADRSSGADFAFEDFILRISPAGSVLDRIAAGAGALAVRPDGGLVVAHSGPAGVLPSGAGSSWMAAHVKVVDFTARDGPRLAAVVNAAGQVSQGLSPGEIISLYGEDLGPAEGVSAQPDNGRFPVELDGVRVLIGGEPAPLLYASAQQINAVAPFELGAAPTVPLRVEREGVGSNLFALTKAAAAPALFTWAGGEQAAALNQDGSPNSAGNPASPDSIVAVFVAGGGGLEPPLPNGALAPLEPPLPRLAGEVAVRVDSRPAEVVYAGAAPGLVAGLSQINFRIPAETPAGEPAVVVYVDGEASLRPVRIHVAP